MNNDVVIVIEDPVEWGVFTRMHGMNPKLVEEENLAPYFKERSEANSRFDAKEIQALEVLNVPCETIVVRRSELTSTGDSRVSYHKLSPEIFESEWFALGSKIRDFLRSLGGDNLCISISGEETEMDEQKRKLKIENEIRTKGGEVAVDYAAQKDFLAEAQKKFSISGTSEKSDPDFDFAAACLLDSEFMTQNFGRLLEDIRNNRLHGKQTGKVSVEVEEKVKEKCQVALNASVKYGLMDDELKASFNEEKTRWEHRCLTFEYSFDLQ